MEVKLGPKQVQLSVRGQIIWDAWDKLLFLEQFSSKSAEMPHFYQKNSNVIKFVEGNGICCCDDNLNEIFETKFPLLTTLGSICQWSCPINNL